MAEGEFVPRLETGSIGAAFENSLSRGVSYGFGSTTTEEEGRRERERERERGLECTFNQF